MNNNVAIVRLSALGDIVNSAFVLQFIKKAHPNLHIHWVVEEAFAPLLRTHPLIDALHTVNLKRLKKEKSLRALLQNISYLRNLGRFEKIVDMQGLIKSAVTARLIGRHTHGFDKDSIREPIASLLYESTSHIPYEANVVLRNARVIGDALGLEITPQMILQKEPVFPILHEEVIPKKRDKKQVAFVIGASWPSKKYPKERLVEVINDLDIEAYVIWGNEQERQEAVFIANNAKNSAIAPKMDLNELVSFISGMDLVIGNDTGPTHMAWAQNIPSITLFGPTNERMIFATPQNIAIHSPSKVDIMKINKQDFSIREIDPKEITQRAKELLYGI